MGWTKGPFEYNLNVLENVTNMKTNIYIYKNTFCKSSKLWLLRNYMCRWNEKKKKILKALARPLWS